MKMKISHAFPTVLVLVLCLSLPAWGAISDWGFAELCEKGSAKEIRAELLKGANPNTRHFSGKTALMFAAMGNTCDVVELLLEAGAEVNAKNDFFLGRGWTALMYAAMMNTPNVVELLLKAGADVNAKNEESFLSNGTTALIFAAMTNTPDVVELLLKAGADVNAKDASGDTALMEAAGRVLINTNFEVMSDVISLLLKAGADVNAKNKNGKTALMYAAGAHTPDVVELLLNAGADVNAKDKNGKTAFDIARECDNTAVVSILEPKTAMSDEDFVKLCLEGSPNEVQAALKKGANPNGKNKNSWTALMAAAGNKKGFDTVSLLLKAGVDVNAKDEDGKTALMFAAESNTPDVVELLLKAGADVSAKDNRGWGWLGWTALDYAQKRGNTRIVKLLESTPANIRKAAEAGNVEAQYKLGMMYATGEGVEEDQWEAVNWLRKAAKQGHKLSRNELGKRGIYE